MANLKSSPLGPYVGEEIHGLDLSRPLAPETIDELSRILANRGVIFLRDQDLTPEQQVAFAARFGEVHVNPYFTAVSGHPQVAEVRKEANDRQNIGEVWHTDNSYYPAPALGSILYAKEIPPIGGDTLFASMYAAYDALSDGLKRTLESMRAVHSTAQVFGATGTAVTQGLNGIRPSDKLPEATHPVVITHPQSGRKALYVNASFTTCFEGWTPQESAPLLNFLYEHGRRPEFQCRFRWQKGSLAFWDNRATWHYAANDYHGHRRLMHRVQVEGTPLH